MAGESPPLVSGGLRDLLCGHFSEGDATWAQPQLLGFVDRLQVLVRRAEVLIYVESADCGLNPPICAAWDDRRYRPCRCSEFPFSRARIHSKHDWKHRSSCICEYAGTSGGPGWCNH